MPPSSPASPERGRRNPQQQVRRRARALTKRKPRHIFVSPDLLAWVYSPRMDFEMSISEAISQAQLSCMNGHRLERGGRSKSAAAGNRSSPMAGGKQSTVSARHPRSLCVLGSHISIVVEYIAIRDGLENREGETARTRRRAGDGNPSETRGTKPRRGADCSDLTQPARHPPASSERVPRRSRGATPP